MNPVQFCFACVVFLIYYFGSIATLYKLDIHQCLKLIM